MHYFAVGLQVVCAVILVVLMAIQTDKAEQSGGVMGIGGAGGRDAGEIDMAVGAERILKPLTRWMAGGFVFASVLAAIPPATITYLHVIAVAVVFVLVMTYGGTLWKLLITPRRS